MSFPQNGDQEKYVPGLPGDIKETFQTAFRFDVKLPLFGECTFLFYFFALWLRLQAERAASTHHGIPDMAPNFPPWLFAQ